MKIFQRVSSKLVLLTAIPLLIFSGMIIGGIKLTNDTNKNAQNVMEVRLQQTQLLSSIIRAFTRKIIDTANKTRSDMILFDAAAVNVSQGRKIIEKAWLQYQQENLSEPEKTIIKKSMPLYDDALKTINKLTVLIGKKSAYKMKKFVDLDLSYGLDPFLEQLDQLVNLQKQLAEEEIGVNTEERKRVIELFFIVMAIVVFVVILLSFSIYRSIKTPLNHLKQVMNNVEKDSNISLRVDINSGDEFQDIGHYFNDMMEKISLLVKTLSLNGQALDSAAHKMMEACKDAREQASSTRDEIFSASSAINKMTASSESIQHFTENTALATRNADSYVTEYFQVIQAETKQISVLADAMTKSAGQVDRLRGNVMDIDAMLGVIKAVAEQTNLLALNAAIEAARAGEQGRGFAVVADEVRSLAHRTQESTQEIESVMQGIRESAELAAEKMHNNADYANKSADSLKKTENNLLMIMQSFSDISNQNNSINEAYSEQTKAVRGVDNNVQSIFSLADKSSETADFVLNTANEVKEFSYDLQQALSQYSY